MDLENARKSAEELRKKLNYHAKKYYEEDNQRSPIMNMI